MKIPKNAKIVFKWIIFDIYQWEQKLFDGSYKTFELAKRKNIAQIIPYRNNLYYLAYEEQPWKWKYYSLIWWQIEHNETPKEWAKRELKEESWFKCKKVNLIKEFTPCSMIDWNIYIYSTNNFTEDWKITLDKSEKIKIISVKFTDFINIVLSENFSWKEFANYIYKLKMNYWIRKIKQILFPN